VGAVAVAAAAAVAIALAPSWGAPAQEPASAVEADGKTDAAADPVTAPEAVEAEPAEAAVVPEVDAFEAPC